MDELCNRIKSRQERYQETDKHFNKCYLDRRRTLLAYGASMNLNRKSADSSTKRPAISVTKHCTTNALPLGSVNYNATVAELSSMSAVGEMIRDFTVEEGIEEGSEANSEEENEAEKELKAVGYIMYCRDRALEEAARNSNENASRIDATPLSSKFLTSGASSAVTTNIHYLLHKAAIRDLAGLKRGVAFAAAKFNMKRSETIRTNRDRKKKHIYS